MKIHPPTDVVELAAALKATELVAFMALSIAMTAVAKLNQHDEETIRASMNDLRRRFILDFEQAKIELSPEDAAGYRAYGEATIEALFGRLTVGRDPMNPMSS